MRDHYEYKDAMFVNSLFKDFLEQNGLKDWKGESTRDIICLEFNYGSRSYQQELDHLYKIANNARNEYRSAKIRKDNYLMHKATQKRDKITSLLEIAIKNKDKYEQVSKGELRKKMYNEGVNVEYITRNRDGEVRKRETIHYKMLYRSTGKAKKGSCMFIVDRLYKKARDFLYMGIKLPKINAPIVEISAYAPLISSGIVGRVKINPKNILILKDVERFFKTNVISVETDEQKHCYAKHIENYELKNTLFDGQALIDSSIFPSWGNGYILLRHHFCKMAAFSTNIQQFFKDHFGDDYSSATVKDMFGNEHYVKDIELITTNNAMKWTKFNVSYDDWCEKVQENGCMFGIVKTAHESKLGDRQRMSYQMVNSLDIKTMDDVCRQSVEYIQRLKGDDAFFLEYLRQNDNFSNDYNVLLALCEHNKNFARSEYFRERKKKIVETCWFKMKAGEITQYAENLTVVGSPYAMLLYATCGDESMVEQDNTFCYEKGTIQCYTERFFENDHLAFFRSPFNSKNNLLYLHNVYSDIFKKYFNLGKQVIAINMIGTDAQDRANGMDMDSDFGLTTNQEQIVEHAKNCYLNCPTIVNNIPMEKNVYNNTLDDYATIDNGLAKSQTDIGESSNLAQLAQTYEYNFDDSKFSNYVCILSVLAQCAIDNSKRRFDIDIADEIKRIKKDMDITTYKYPKFWKIIKRGFKSKNINSELDCPMNYLCDVNLAKIRSSEKTLSMDEFFIKHSLDLDTQRKTSKRVEALIEEYSLSLLNFVIDENTEHNDWILLRSDFDKLIRDIASINISTNYLGLMSWLIDRAFVITPTMKKNSQTNTKLKNNRSVLIKVLYTVNPQVFLKCFKKC